jgi:hypothetical protein
MDDVLYTHRSRSLATPRTYRLSGDTLAWSGDGPEEHVALAEIREVHVYRMPGISAEGGDVPPEVCCTLRTSSHAGHGRMIKLSSAHEGGLRGCPERCAALRPFLAELFRRIAAASPDAVFVRGMPPRRHVAAVLVLLVSLFLVALGLGWAALVALAPEWTLQEVLGALVLVAVFLPLAFVEIQMLWQNATRRFDPRSADWDDVWGPAPGGRAAVAP